MTKFIYAVNKSVGSFVQDEEGAQVVEYALIIAVVSIGLVLALSNGTVNLKQSFAALIGRVNNCFAVGATTC